MKCADLLFRNFLEMTGGKPVQKDFNVIVERDEEGFYVATVPELREKGDALKKLS